MSRLYHCKGVIALAKSIKLTNKRLGAERASLQHGSKHLKVIIDGIMIAVVSHTDKDIDCLDIIRKLEKLV